jgi:hypothetical protein
VEAIMGRHYPAMALVEVVRLVEARAKVEIEATAVVRMNGEYDHSSGPPPPADQLPEFLLLDYPERLNARRNC